MVTVGERLSVGLHEQTGFSMGEVNDLLTRLEDGGIIDSLVDIGLSPEAAERFWQGEGSRVRALHGYHRFLDEALVGCAVKVDQPGSVFELASGTGIYPALSGLRPRERWWGLDNDPKVVTMAEAIQEKLKETGQLPVDVDYKVIEGNQDTSLVEIAGEKAPWSVAFMGSQYIEPQALVRWIGENGERGFVGDIAPLDLLVADLDISDGIVPINDNGFETGFRFNLTDEPQETTFGLVAPVVLENSDGLLVVRDGDSNTGHITIRPSEKDGFSRVNAWAWIEKEDGVDEQELGRMAGCYRALTRIFEAMVGGSNAPYKLPRLAIDQGQAVSMRVNSLNDLETGVASAEVADASIPLSVLLRYWGDVEALEDDIKDMVGIGQGEGNNFVNLSEFREYVAYLVTTQEGRNKLNNMVGYANPPLLAIEMA